MAKTIIKPGLNRNGGPHLLKIMFDDNEPPKNYIWGKPDGFFYKWKNGSWEPVDITKEIADSNETDISCGCSCSNNMVSKCYLKEKLEALKNDLLTQVVKMQNNACSDKSAIEEFIRQLEARITALEQKPDIDTIYDDSELRSRITNLEDSVENISSRLDGLDTSVSNLQSSVSEINNNLTNNYYTKEEVDNKALNRDEFEQLALELGFVKMIDTTFAEYEALEEKEPNVVYNITDAEAYHYDDTAIRSRLDSLENDNRQTKLDVIDLDNRVDELEAIDHSAFVTAADLAPYENPDLTPYATKNDLIGLATETYVNNAINNIEQYDDTEVRQIIEDNALVTSSALNDLNDRVDSIESNYATKSYVDDAVSGISEYDDTNISNRVSALEAIDHSQFLTEHQSLDGYATEQYVNNAVNGIDVPSIDGLATTQYVDNKVSGLINSAPETLDTLKELSDALGGDSNFATTMATELGKKANIADLAAVATSGSYNDLTDKPTIPTVPTNVSEFTNDAGYLTSHQSLADYSTTSEMTNAINSAISTATEDMATESWVDTNFEYKFDSSLADDTVMTDEEKIAEAGSHTDDNKVYITMFEPTD